MPRSASALVLALGCVTSPGHAADLVTNGSFEAPTVTLNSYQQATPDGWSWAGSQGLLFNGLVLDAQSGVNWPTAEHGQQFVDIGNVSAFSLYQTFAIVASGAYQLTWQENAHPNANSSPYSAILQDGSLSSLLDVTLNAANGGVWQQQVYVLNLNVGTYTLAFTAKGVPQGYDTLLDNVALTAAVPEPATTALLLAALPLFLWRLQRGRNAGPGGGPLRSGDA